MDKLKIEREEIEEEIEDGIDEVSLPGVYTKGRLSPDEASRGAENVTAHKSSIASPAKAPPVAPKIAVKKSAPTPIKSAPPQPTLKPQPLVLARQKDESREQFTPRFRKRLDDLPEQSNQKRREQVKKNLKKIIVLAREHNRIDNEDVRKITELNKSRAQVYLDILEKRGKLVQFGANGPKVFYKPTSKLL